MQWFYSFIVISIDIKDDNGKKLLQSNSNYIYFCYLHMYCLTVMLYSRQTIESNDFFPLS